MAAIPSATELLLTWDAGRPRSQQQELGMSALGDCRRRAGYIMHGVPADEGYDGQGNIQAVLGTAIHEALASAARKAGLGEAAGIENMTVSFGGLTGHPDLLVEPVLRDYKTVGYTTQLEKIRSKGPPQRHLWQVSVYAAALIRAGYQVTTVELDYIARDSGEEHLWSAAFDIQHVRDAMAWLKNVRTAQAGHLPRDARPESAMCTSCPFFQRCWLRTARPERSPRTALYADWPHAADWARLLKQAEETRLAAKEHEADAKGALDVLRTVTEPGESQLVAVPGLDGEMIRFSIARGRRTPDMEQISRDYERAGAKPPMKQGEPIARVSIVKAGPPR